MINLLLTGVPALQTPEAVAYLLRRHRDVKFASSVLLDQDQPRLAQRVERFVR